MADNPFNKVKLDSLDTYLGDNYSGQRDFWSNLMNTVYGGMGYMAEVKNQQHERKMSGENYVIDRITNASSYDPKDRQSMTDAMRTFEKVGNTSGNWDNSPRVSEHFQTKYKQLQGDIDSLNQYESLVDEVLNYGPTVKGQVTGKYDPANFVYGGGGAYDDGSGNLTGKGLNDKLTNAKLYYQNAMVKLQNTGNWNDATAIIVQDKLEELELLSSHVGMGGQITNREFVAFKHGRNASVELADVQSQMYNTQIRINQLQSAVESYQLLKGSPEGQRTITEDMYQNYLRNTYQLSELSKMMPEYQARHKELWADIYGMGVDGNPVGYGSSDYAEANYPYAPDGAIHVYTETTVDPNNPGNTPIIVSTGAGPSQQQTVSTYKEMQSSLITLGSHENGGWIDDGDMNWDEDRQLLTKLEHISSIDPFWDQSITLQDGTVTTNGEYWNELNVKWQRRGNFKEYQDSPEAIKVNEIFGTEGLKLPKNAQSKLAIDRFIAEGKWDEAEKVMKNLGVEPEEYYNQFKIDKEASSVNVNTQDLNEEEQNNVTASESAVYISSTSWNPDSPVQSLINFANEKGWDLNAMISANPNLLGPDGSINSTLITNTTKINPPAYVSNQSVNNVNNQSNQNNLLTEEHSNEWSPDNSKGGFNQELPVATQIAGVEYDEDGNAIPANFTLGDNQNKTTLKENTEGNAEAQLIKQIFPNVEDLNSLTEHQQEHLMKLDSTFQNDVQFFFPQGHGNQSLQWGKPILKAGDIGTPPLPSRLSWAKGMSYEQYKQEWIKRNPYQKK